MGSSSAPAIPAVTAIPATIMIQVIAAAAARRSGATRVASNASSEVPAAPTPMPIIANAAIASASPPGARAARSGSAPTASKAPSASTAMPPMIQGVRRAPRSEPCPQTGRDSWTA